MALDLPDPPLATERILLRPFRLDDAEALAEACQDPDIPRFTFMPDDMDVDGARLWLERAAGCWENDGARFAITVPPDDRLIGQVGVAFELMVRRVETFYWVDARHRRRGIASEALELATEWAFTNFDVVRAQLLTDVDNEGSQLVAAACGYEREGLLRGYMPVKGAQRDLVMWGRLKTWT